MDGRTGVTVLQPAVQVNVFVREHVINQNHEMAARSVLVPVNKLVIVQPSLVQVDTMVLLTHFILVICAHCAYLKCL